MSQFRHDLQIARTPAEVFAFINDVAATPRWERVVEATSSPPGPLAVGSRLRKVGKLPGGGRVTITQEILALDPGSQTRRERVVGGMMAGTTASWTMVPNGQGTALSCTVDVAAGGIFKLALPLLAMSLKSQVGAELRALKSVLEAGDAAGGEASG